MASAQSLSYYIRSMVVIFSTPGCAPCDLIKGWLSRKGIEFKEEDAIEAGYYSSPTVNVNGMIMVRPSLSMIAQQLEA
jgi:glutaredoxin